MMKLSLIVRGSVRIFEDLGGCLRGIGGISVEFSWIRMNLYGIGWICRGFVDKETEWRILGFVPKRGRTRIGTVAREGAAQIINGQPSLHRLLSITGFKFVEERNFGKIKI